MHILTKKRALGALATLAVLAVAGVAFAYFTDTGTGNGTASVGGSSTVSLVGTITGTLTPAGSPASVSVLVTNTGAGSQKVKEVSLVSVEINTSSPVYTEAEPTQRATWDTCVLSSSGSDPAFTEANISVEETLTKSGTAGNHTTKTGSLQMNDTGTSQDNCKNAPLKLVFTSN